MARKVVNITESPSENEDGEVVVITDTVELVQAAPPAAAGGRAALSLGTAPAPAAARRATGKPAGAKPATKSKQRADAALKGNASIRSMFAQQLSTAGQRACAQCTSSDTASCAACSARSARP